MKTTITTTIRIGTVVTALALASASDAMGITLTDDYNDNSKNTNYWSPLHALNFGLLTETSQRLEYTTAETNSSQDRGSWDWMVSADVNSLVVLQVDANVPDLPITTEQRAGFGIALQSSSVDRVVLSLAQRISGGNFYKYIGSSVVKGATEVDSAEVAISGSAVSLRLTWSPGSQFVTAEYDLDGPANGYVWTRLAQWQLSNYGWPGITNLTESVGGDSRNRTINPSDSIFGDNCQITYTPQTPTSSAALAQETFFFRMESGGPTRVIEIDRNGLLTWSNAVTPTSFYLSGALSLNPTGAWHRVVYGETTNGTPTIQAPLVNPLVCLGFSGHGTNMWIGRPFGTSRVQIKNSGNRIRFAWVSRDEQHILYAEENVYGTEDCAIRLYDVPSDVTTTLLTHAGHNLAFDPQDQRYFFYIGSPPSTTIFRRALDGSTDTPWITDTGHVISAFVQSPDGNRIIIKSGDAGPPYLDRFVTFTSQGAFERLLLETSFDGYNFSFNPTGDQAVVSYRDMDCSGERHVIVYNLNTGAGLELPTVGTNWWPISSCALYIAWAPYDDLLVSANTGGNVFCSPVDGHVTGTVSLPSGYELRGFGSDWRVYATDQSLTHILRLQRNP